MATGPAIAGGIPQPGRITQLPIPGSLQIPAQAATGSVAIPAPGQTQITPQDELSRMTKAFTAPESQITQAAQTILPEWQKRLQGLFGPASDAMRLNAQQDIQAQYGNALRGAMQTAGNQGIRGPAAAAMQQDIRNQMGMAQAKFNRDLTVADYQAQLQGLQGYEGAYGRQAANALSLPVMQQQQRNIEAGYGTSDEILGRLLAGQNSGSGGLGGFLQSVWGATPFGMISNSFSNRR
jgi:hypothetical protein